MILVVLKYAGLFLATATSIWGTMNELTTKTDSGRKQLTKAGLFSVTLVIIGLIISIVSDDFSRKAAAKTQMEKLESESKRTNEIIIAGQPLTSLSFSLEFESSDTVLASIMKNAAQAIQENAESEQGGVPRIPFETEDYESSLIPMLKFLGRLCDSSAKSTSLRDSSFYKRDNGVVALIPLDASPNSVLSFGQINGNLAWSNKDSTNRLSAGFTPVNNATAGIFNPSVGGSTTNENYKKYSINWNLDPLTLENAIDRVNSKVRSTAMLPRQLRMIILTHFDNLPFSRYNFAVTNSNQLWVNDSTSASQKYINSISDASLSMIVNGFRDLAFRYELVRVFPIQLYDDFGDELEITCTALEFKRD